MVKAKILSLGHYVPEKILTNFDLEKMVETSDDWIVKRTGIKERHIAEKDEYTSSMGVKASKLALEKAGLSPLDIDLIICATITGDYITPSTACIIQSEIGASNAFSFDISAACSGFLYAISIAESFILKDPNKKILVVAVEKLSSITNWQDRSTCVLFGDGAGAAIIEADNYSGIEKTFLKSDGTLYDYLIVPLGGSKAPINVDNVNNPDRYLTMQGNSVFKHAINKMLESIEKVIELSSWKKEDIKMLFTHQANIRIIDAIRKNLNFDEEKVFIDLEKYGNTSAATIPIALDEAVENNLIKRGDKIILSSFGGGFTWGATSIIW